MTRKKIILVIFMSFISVTFLEFPVYSEQAGGILLELPVSARASGMAESYTALSDEPLGIFYNPAGIGFLQVPSFSISHQSYIQGIYGEFSGLVYPFKNFVLGGCIGYIWMIPEPVYDYLGRDTEEKITYRGLILPLSISKTFKFIGEISLGTSIKYYFENINDYNGNLLTLDFGSIFKYRNFTFGLALTNLFGKIQDFSPPRITKFNIAYTHKILICSFEVNRNSINKELLLSLGTEIKIKDIFLRAGYNTRGFSSGFGLKFKRIMLNYSYSGLNKLGNVYKIEINYKL